MLMHKPHPPLIFFKDIAIACISANSVVLSLNCNAEQLIKSQSTETYTCSAENESGGFWKLSEKETDSSR
jgi:hypothetical protein